MPIDFNAHINFTKNPQVKINQQVYTNNNQLQKDIFVKSINVNSDADYDCIKINRRPFGKVEKTGEKATLYTITNKNGMSVDLSTFGATITGIKVKDKKGNIVDVAQGYDNVTPYEKSPVGHAGGTIGPCANKISGGEFIINGEKYTLECNKDNGKTHCHGGSEGFDVKNWKAKVLKDGIEFTYLKKDMEAGYPGNVETKVTYKLDNENKLHIKYHAETDKDTLLNLTNHTYFNLDGAENTGENSVLDHIVTLPNSSKITENNEISVPTGKYIDVENTPFDFRKEHKINDVININHGQLKTGSGFDHNYCIDNYDGKTMQEIANIKSDKTGIKLRVYTNMQGFQFYTANHLGKTTQPLGKDGRIYEKRSAFCIEPQVYPNAINTPEFEEKGILRKDAVFDKEIIYSFEAE